MRTGGARNASSYSNRRLPASLGVFVVPQQSAWVVERFGKFHEVLEPGLHFAVPFVDRVAYVWSMKEQALSITNQTAVTKDNVTIQIDGVLYIRVTDAEGASYGVEDAIFALQQLAQTTMRSELGKMTLDNTFEERERLNTNIVRAINEAAATWGVKCLRYEIRDILPPTSVRVAMDMQAEAERRRRAEITEADGKKEAIIRRAQAEAQAIYARSEATAESIKRMAHSVVSHGGAEVVAVRLAEQYVQAFAELARKGNTLILPANAGDPASMVAQALGIYDSLRSKTTAHAAGAAASAAEPAPADASTHTQDAIADGSLRASAFPSTPLTGSMDDDNMPWRR